MPVEFDVKLTAKDMFRFNMYHTYTSFQGIITVFLGVCMLALGIMSAGKADTLYVLLYFLFGVVFLCHTPFNLYASSKLRMAKSDTLSETMHYSFDEEGIEVSIGTEKAKMMWKQVYKIVQTKTNLLVYSSRRNAYILPLSEVGDNYGALVALIRQQVDKRDLKIRKA